MIWHHWRVFLLLFFKYSTNGFDRYINLLLLHFIRLLFSFLCCFSIFKSISTIKKCEKKHPLSQVEDFIFTVKYKSVVVFTTPVPKRLLYSSNTWGCPKVAGWLEELELLASARHGSHSCGKVPTQLSYSLVSRPEPKCPWDPKIVPLYKHWPHF